MSVPAYHPPMVKVMGSGVNLGGPTQLMESSRKSSKRGLNFINNNSTVNVKMGAYDGQRHNMDSAPSAGGNLTDPHATAANLATIGGAVTPGGERESHGPMTPNDGLTPIHDGSNNSRNRNVRDAGAQETGQDGQPVDGGNGGIKLPSL